MTTNKTDAPKKKARRRITDQGGGPLDCKRMEGYHLRFAAVNSPHDPLNIERLLDRGYTFVTPEEQGITIEDSAEGSVLKEHNKETVRRTGRDGITLVLMKLPLELYREDLDDIARANNQNVERLVANKVNKVGLQEENEVIINGKKL